MSKYQPVCPSSPDGESPDAGESEEQQAVHAKQNERLLAANELADGAAEQRADRPKIALAWGLAVFALLVIVGLSLSARAVFRHKTPVQQATKVHTATSIRRPDIDFVLDQDWDYNAPPTVRNYHWVITDVEAGPDGVFRPMLVINGQFPGEMIRCNDGDTIVVHVDNQAGNATAIHWHGIFQNGSNWMDGTPGVTQCPIAPGHTFRYEFTIAGQSGTYFYHGHQGAQAHDGLVGPMVVHSRLEKTLQRIPYASDRVVLLQDWYYDQPSALLYQKLSHGSKSSPVPNGALINGANKVDCVLHPARKCDATQASLATLDLVRNQNHRLRLLNVGAFAWFEVTADGHPDLPVTEVDGTNVEPVHDRSVLIAPGQRYSVVLGAISSAGDSFWLRARMIKHCFAESVLPEHGIAEARAILRYSPTAATPATENDSGRYAVVCKDAAVGRYRPIPAARAPEYADHSWLVRVKLEIGDWRLERGFMNQSSYRPNLRSPTLHRVLDGLSAENASFQAQGTNALAFDPAHELVVSTSGVQVVDVIVQNMDEGNHPFHLHGYHFFVLAAGHAYFPGYEALGLRAGGRGLADPQNATVVDNPLHRDVATVEGFGWMLVRFVADNPGVWLFHCHMLWHAELGMAMQFVSRLDLLAEWAAVPRANADLCRASAADLETR